MSSNNGTQTPATVWYFSALRTSSTLTLTSQGGKVVRTINIKTLESLWDTLTGAEQTLYSWIENDTVPNVTSEISLTMAEMQTMKSIIEKVTPMTTAQSLDQSNKVVLNGIASRTHSTANADAINHEHRISHLTNVLTACDEEYYMLQYDIPTVKADVCPSPCNLLWRYGFRTTLSVWVLPKSSLEAQEIVDLRTLWKANDIKVRVMKYDESEVAAIKEMAREELEGEIRRAHTALIDNIAAADDRLKEAMNIMGPISPATLDKAEEYRDNQVRTHIKKAGEHLINAISCAELFDNTENVKDLLDALREAVNSQRSSFNVRMYAKGRKPA